MALKQQLIDVNLMVNAALVKGDAAEAASCFTEDGTCITPDMEITRGQTALTDLFQSWIDFGIASLRDDSNVIEYDGEIVVMTCNYQCEYRQTDGTILPESGKALEVLMRDRSNNWKIHSICFATDSGSPQIPISAD
ncbi:MAG: nuclear transport factor 2 family protein [Gammaproteobacteria bacterium]|nr:nuclear transport factor 2 family protein [Gammaproteobacteria bacterium]